MRWRIGFLLAALALLLSGCAAEYAWETVEDVLPETVQASAPAYRLMLGVAEDVLAPVFSDDGMTAVYEQKNGDYEITAQTLPAQVRAISHWTSCRRRCATAMCAACGST